MQLESGECPDILMNPSSGSISSNEALHLHSVLYAPAGHELKGAGNARHVGGSFLSTQSWTNILDVLRWIATKPSNSKVISQFVFVSIYVLTALFHPMAHKTWVG